ncbi:hypothetical protein O181_107125 [Austropuccinia psidii MF-1]|uniref:Integrase catalytic domain-containing protein n=1 Tax=Austropuccinia psidii MF-1 TaxID=1389203 RepID=A0A9Q3PNB0_9BASI|nr:hypothetical protein [Austropuccinia psidii MF-1]
MIHIQKPKSPWEVVQMDWVTALPPSGDRSYNACLVIVYRYRKTPIFLPCHKDDTAMDTALLLWSRAFHPQTDGLSERMIQALGDMIRRFCAHELEFKDSDGFTHDWFTLIPALELANKTSVHSSTGQTPAIETSCKKSINDAFEYAKQKWDKSHKVPDFKVGELVSVSTLNFNNIKGPKKLKDYCVGPFVIVAFMEPMQFKWKNPTTLTVPPVEQSEDRKIKKVIKERRLRGKNQREYLVRYRNPVHEDEWLEESEIPDSDKLLRRFRPGRRPQA